MTNHEANRLCKIWQKRLRLSDWDIDVRVKSDESMGDAIGEVMGDQAELSASIDIAETQADHEGTIIHELLHIRMYPWSDGSSDEPDHEARETALNVMAACFKAAYPKRSRRTSKATEVKTNDSQFPDKRMKKSTPA